MDARLINKIILKDPLVREVLRIAPHAYLVGGYIRDILLLGSRSKDIDIVIKEEGSSVAQEIKNILGGTIVFFGDELTRIVLENQKTIDITSYSVSIHEDLLERDFTINSIAWSPSDGIIDPSGGIHDLKVPIFKTLNANNLISDPLRMLRTYRFLSQLGGRIHHKTRGIIRKHAFLIKNVAPERITAELFKILNTDIPEKALRLALKDGILNHIVPLSNRELKRNIQHLSKVPVLIKDCERKFQITVKAQGLSQIGVLRLEILLKDTNLDKCKLALSSNLLKRLKIFNSVAPSFKNLRRNTLKNMFKCFHKAGEASEDILILQGKKVLLPYFYEYMSIQKRALLSANEIMEITGLPTGKRIGELYSLIKEYQFRKLIKNKHDALSLIRKNINKYP